MTDIWIAQCPGCRVSEFEVAHVTPEQGDVYIRLRCTRCRREFTADLKPKLQSVDELPL